MLGILITASVGRELNAILTDWCCRHEMGMQNILIDNRDSGFHIGLVLVLVLLMSLWSGIKDFTKSILDVDQDSGQSKSPNILMLVADDLGYDDISAINPGGITTPNINQIAREGALFTRHYADSTCSPSRVAILTGRYPERSGFRHGGIEIPSEFPTLAEHLANFGYKTYMTGKWHAGEERREGWPDHKGFEEWFGFLNQWELSDKDKIQPTYFNPWLRSESGKMSQYEGHLTDILTDNTIKKLREFKRSNSPWFLYHAYLAPHTPIQPDLRYQNKYPQTKAGMYSALVNQLDDSVGRIVSEVKDDPNTIIIFVSDNGGPNEYRNNNFPFYGKKNEVYEGSYRTPLIIRWPAKVQPQVVDAVVYNLDITPTILAATGNLIPSGFDGKSILQSLVADVAIEDRSRSWEQFNWNIETMSFSYLSVNGRWRVSFPYGLGAELFDLSSEFSGSDNVAEKYPDVVQNLMELYRIDRISKSLLDVDVVHHQKSNSMVYSGFDLMRTPYLNGFAIGIEVGPLLSEKDSKPLLLAEQKGIWGLVYSPGKGIEWHIGNEVLSGSYFDPTRCNRLVLTGDIQREQKILKDESNRKIAKLYSGGFLQDKAEDVKYTSISEVDVSEPTVIYHGGKALFSNLVLSSYSDSYNPVISAEHYETFLNLHRDQRLAMPLVSDMDNKLCN